MRPVHDLSTPISARMDNRQRFSRSTPSGARREVMGARRTYEGDESGLIEIRATRSRQQKNSPRIT